MNSSLTVIPSRLTNAKDMGGLQSWMLDWTPTTSATMSDEIRAFNGLHQERFVRRNVSSKKFQEWLGENPRFFTTENEMKYRAGKLRDSVAT